MKKLSIIITGRNDNYLNNYIDQTGRALNYTLKSIYEKKLEKNIELVFIDWGSGKLISDEIFIENKYKKLISFYHVPLKISKKERDCACCTNNSFLIISSSIFRSWRYFLASPLSHAETQTAGKLFSTVVFRGFDFGTNLKSFALGIFLFLTLIFVPPFS